MPEQFPTDGGGPGPLGGGNAEGLSALSAFGLPFAATSGGAGFGTDAGQNSNSSGAGSSDDAGGALLSALNNGGPALFSISGVTVREGTSATFTITRTGNLLKQVSIDFATSSGSATSGVDFTATAGTLQFAPGQISLKVSVQTLPDGAAEASEVFNFTISTAAIGADAEILVPSVTATVLNNTAPTAGDDTVSVLEDLVGVNLTAQILGNDSSNDAGDVLRITAVGTAAVGSVSLVNGAVVYSASGHDSVPVGVVSPGADSFTYTVTDEGGLQATATVTIDITGVNDNPVAVDDSVATSQNVVLAAAPGTRNLVTGIGVGGLADSDIDIGATLALTPALLTSTLGASVTVNADGSFLYDGTAAASLIALANGAVAVDTFIYTLVDGNGGADTGTVSVSVSGVNDAPVIAGDLAVTVLEGGTVAITTTDLTENDPDDSGAGLTYTLTTGPATGQLELTTGPSAAITSFTQADVEAGRVIYVHDGSEVTNDSFNFSLADGGEDGAVADVGTFNISVTAVNDAPVLGGTVVSATATESGVGTNVVALVTGATVSDADAANFAGGSLVVTLTDGAQAGDVLSLAGGNGQTGIVSVDAATPGVLTINLDAAATAAQVAVLINDLRYANTGDDATAKGTDGDRAYSIVLNDGGNSPGLSQPSNALSGTVTVVGENDAPVLGGTVVSGTATESGVGTSVVALVTGATVSDVDAANFAGGSLVVTLTDGAQAGDVLSLAGGNAQTGIVSVNAATPGVLTINLDAAATAAQVAVLINDLRYANTGDDATAKGADGDRAYSIVLNDGGNSPGPAQPSNALSGTVTVVGENDAPVVDANGVAVGVDFTAGFEVEAGAQLLVDAGATVFDADTTNLSSLTVTLTNRPDGDGVETLSVDGPTALANNVTVAAYVPATGVLLLSGAATPAEYEAVLRTLRYDNASTAATVDTTPRTVTVVANDGTDTGSATVTVNLSTAPVVDLDGADSGGINFAATFTEPGTAGSVVPVSIVDTTVGVNGLTVTDADGDNVAQTTVTLTNRPDGVSEVLAVDAAVATANSITVTAYNAATGVLLLSGSQAAANYQNVLRTLTYNNTSDTPTASARAVEVVVRDVNAVDSATATSTVTVVATNDAPQVTGTVGGVAFVESGTGGTAVALVSGATVLDRDAANFVGGELRVTLDNFRAGDVLSVAGGTTLGTVSGGAGADLVIALNGTADAASVQTLLGQLRYANSGDDPSFKGADGDRVVTVTLNDGGNSPGPAQQAQISGTLTVTGENDAPQIVGATVGGVAFVESGVGGTAVALVSGATVSDADAANFVGGELRVTLDNFRAGDV